MKLTKKIFLAMTLALVLSLAPIIASAAAQGGLINHGPLGPYLPPSSFLNDWPINIGDFFDDLLDDDGNPPQVRVVNATWVAVRLRPGSGNLDRYGVQNPDEPIVGHLRGGTIATLVGIQEVNPSVSHGTIDGPFPDPWIQIVVDCFNHDAYGNPQPVWIYRRFLELVED